MAYIYIFPWKGIFFSQILTSDSGLAIVLGFHNMLQYFTRDKGKISFIFFYNLKLPNSITFCFQRALSFCVPKEIIVTVIYNNICLPLQLQKMICLVLWYFFVKIIIIRIRLCSLQSRK